MLTQIRSIVTIVAIVTLLLGWLLSDTLPSFDLAFDLIVKLEVILVDCFEMTFQPRLNMVGNVITKTTLEDSHFS